MNPSQVTDNGIENIGADTFPSGLAHWIEITRSERSYY